MGLSAKIVVLARDKIKKSIIKFISEGEYFAVE